MNCQSSADKQIQMLDLTVWRHCFSSTTSGLDKIMLEVLSGHYDIFLKDLERDWRVDFDDLNGVSYDLDTEQNLIVLHNHGLRTEQALLSPYFRPQIFIALAEALRMARHVESLEGMLERFDPQAIILIGRLCVADTAVQAITFAWEAKKDGDNALWKHILCGDTSDMAVAFDAALEKYLSSGMDFARAFKKSSAVAFNQWFAVAERIRGCDHDTLDLIDSMVSEGTKFKGKKADKNTVTCLTLSQGGGGSYIDAFLQDDILKNPYYSVIADPINAAHFSQILSDLNTVRVGGLVFNDPQLAARFAIVEE